MITIPYNICPICGSALSQELECDQLLKQCSDKDDHKYSFVCSLYFRTYLDVRLIFSDKNNIYNVTWDFSNNETFIIMNNCNHIAIPMFDADFTNLEKIISKIKTYILFS